MHRSSEAGHTLLEALVVLGILVVMAAFLIPSVRAYSAEVPLMSAGRKFKSAFLKARSVRSASVFESGRRSSIPISFINATTCAALA